MIIDIIITIIYVWLAKEVYAKDIDSCSFTQEVLFYINMLKKSSGLYASVFGIS